MCVFTLWWKYLLKTCIYLILRNDKFNLHMIVFIYLLMLKINIKCLIVLCYIEGLYILCKTHQQNEIRHSKCVVELENCPFFLICEDLS